MVLSSTRSGPVGWSKDGLQLRDWESENLRGSTLFQKLHNYLKQSQDWIRGSNWPLQAPGEWAAVWGQGRSLHTRAATCLVRKVIGTWAPLLAANCLGLLLCFNAAGGGGAVAESAMPQ